MEPFLGKREEHSTGFLAPPTSVERIKHGSFVRDTSRTSPLSESLGDEGRKIGISDSPYILDSGSGNNQPDTLFRLQL